jgi:hypothetical protein
LKRFSYDFRYLIAIATIYGLGLLIEVEHLTFFVLQLPDFYLVELFMELGESLD